MKKDPSTNVHASEDFFLTIVEGHVLCAAMDAFGMSSLMSHEANLPHCSMYTRRGTIRPSTSRHRTAPSEC